MTAVGILTMTRIGNQHHYKANHECVIFSELSGIVRKTFGIADVIKLALKQRDAQIDLAFIYGSIARAQEIASSDIDLMVVGRDLTYAEVMEMLFEAEQSLGRTINPTIYDAKELGSKLEQKNAFIVRVMEQPKIWIKGVEDDISASG